MVDLEKVSEIFKFHLNVLVDRVSTYNQESIKYWHG